MEDRPIGSVVVDLDEVRATDVDLVGGKGANLGELRRIPGTAVPDGWCITTDAFRQVLAGPSVVDALDCLSIAATAGPDDLVEAGALARRVVAAAPVPDEIVAAVTEEVTARGPDVAWAVRSSATVEDSPHASFAGQMDSFLGVVGVDAVLAHVRRCWASAFTDRAVAERRRHGIDPRDLLMAVVVQRMVDPVAAGVVFTAHPVTSDRRVAVVEAVPGSGAALVAGRVEPDRFEVREGVIVGRSTVDRGTDRAVLADDAVVDLVDLCRRVEHHLGTPQDVEWCLADDGFHLVQSRAITTAFPVPATDDGATHVYVSVGHQQMMTDAMRPLGLTVWQMIARAPMVEAGGRLFVEITSRLASAVGRQGLVAALGRGDPLLGDALRSVIDRDLVPTIADEGDAPTAPPGAGPPPDVPTDPEVVARLVARTWDAHAAAAEALGALSGPDVLAFVRRDVEDLQRVVLGPEVLPAVMASMDAAWWLDERMREWLGERGAADVLARAVPGDVTAEMGLALLDVADALRPHPEVVAHLRTVPPGSDGGFLRDLELLSGGPDARRAIEGWLDRYGMRGQGEIDITRPRWRERPATLLPVLLGHVDALDPGEHERRLERGRAAAREAETDLITRLRELPDGDAKAEETAATIARLRTFAGFREHPKFALIARLGLYKEAMAPEIDRLVATGVIGDRDDASFLTFDELEAAVRTGRADTALDALIVRRREEHRWHASLTPPRILTSHGETFVGSHHRDDAPPGALVGVAVSAGTVEGTARVVHDLAAARLRLGDVLVTTHTDPSWTPAFVTVAGLVTEVGGVMTHGAVIAREYGLPAVVGVDGATRRIRDGQRIRVHGTDGVVELLD